MLYCGPLARIDLIQKWISWKEENILLVKSISEFSPERLTFEPEFGWVEATISELKLKLVINGDKCKIKCLYGETFNSITLSYHLKFFDDVFCLTSKTFYLYIRFFYMSLCLWWNQSFWDFSEVGEFSTLTMLNSLVLTNSWFL